MPLPAVRRHAAVLLLAAAMKAQDAEPPRHLVEVRTTGPAQMRQLMALDLDLAGCRTPLLAERRIEVIATDRDLDRLARSGLAFTVLQRDLSAHYAAQAARFVSSDLPNPPLGQGAMGGHWTLAQMEAILDDLHQLNPAICSSRTQIGTSVENRPIWMVKISDNVGVDENEPEVLYDALHHAREPLSMEATIVFMDWLVTNYGSDPLATFLVDERELYFVPCVNPDGYEWNRTNNPGGGGMWRKNRRDNGNGTFGVDLNRNYATAWNAPNGGSSTSTNSETYRGPAPFSEPETQALEAFAASRQFVAVFTTHTYTDVLLRPYGYQVADPANAADYDALGSYFVRENGVQQGRLSTLLYIASGSAVDHHHEAHGALAWTAELGRSNEGGFWPSGPAIIDIAMRHQPMFRKVALTAGAALEIADVAVTEAPGGNGNGTVEAGETALLVVTVTNRGIAAAPAVLDLQLVTPGLQPGAATAALGTVPRLQQASNAAQPLSFQVPAGFQPLVATVRIVLTGDGRSQERVVEIPLVEPRLILADDAEQDRGFLRAAGGTATTGLWERAVPQQTVSGGNVIQPGFQTTPGGALCFVTDGRAGSSAGDFDVDNGYTDLWSPPMDLRHLRSAEVAFQLYFTESASNDTMTVDVSRDGGANWQNLHSRSTSTGAWTRLQLDLGAPLTDRMVVRVRAVDLVASLVECLVDDFELHGVAADGSLTLLGSGALGSTLQIAMLDQPGAFCFALAGPALGPGLVVPGVDGTLLLDPAGAAAFDGRVADARGRAAHELLLPANASLSGAVFHFQMASLGQGGARFGGNTTTVTLR